MMQKKLGFLFGVAFIIVAVLNFLDTPKFFCLNVFGLLMVGIAFIESTYFGVYGRVIQILTMIATSNIMVMANDPNSLVPILTIFLAILISHRYFPKHKKLASYYTMFPLITSILNSHWKLVSIVNNSLLYIILTSVLYIVLNDKVEDGEES